MTDELFNDENEFVGPEQSPLVLSRLCIEGFWGTRQVEMRFDSDANFIIGPNGCGKTTIVNLLAACLLADFTTLDRIEFSRVEIELSNRSERAAEITVTKALSKGLPFGQIGYGIYDRRTASRMDFGLDDMNEQIAAREMLFIGRKRISKVNSLLITELRKLCSVTWLSVHRSDFGTREREEKSFDSLVDIKLDHQANALVRYFSRLDQEIAEALRDFQQVMFLSLLADGNTENWFSAADQVDLDREREVLLAIFDQFSMQKSAYASKVERHFNLVSDANTKATEGAIDLATISSLLSQVKVHQIVAEWKKFQVTRDEILRLRLAFISRVNRMLINKEIYVTKANDVAVRTKSGRNLSLKALSSGEKQLLIIMAEALLQEGRPVIYIADEPELSLHVAWQEMLVSNIRGINENAQIVFATHSPDIVSEYGENVIKALEVIGDGIR